MIPIAEVTIWQWSQKYRDYAEIIAVESLTTPEDITYIDNLLELNKVERNPLWVHPYNGEYLYELITDDTIKNYYSNKGDLL